MVVYDEDFENGTAGLAPIRPPAYTGATGMTYTAPPSWLAFCNGWVMDHAERGPVPAECQTDEFWNTLADVSTAIGEYNGDAAPAENHSVAAWTEDGTYTPTDVQLQTNGTVPVTGADHYLTASVSSGAVCCHGTYADPQQNFLLTTGGTEIGRDGDHVAAADADLGGDGRIDPDEYRTGMLRLSGARPGPPGSGALAAAWAIWALCDRDDDGWVTAEEFGRFHRALGLPPGTAGLAFERLDLDGDGTLSVDELATALWEFWTRDDAGALGDRLFGGEFLTAAG